MEKYSKSYQYSETKSKEDPWEEKPKTRDDEGGTCCDRGEELEQKITRYISVVTCIFAAILGPYSGSFIAAGRADVGDVFIYINAGATGIFFLLSLVLASRFPCWIRCISRLWLL